MTYDLVSRQLWSHLILFTPSSRPLTCATPATLVSLMLLEHTKHVPISGLVQLLFLLSTAFFPQISSVDCSLNSVGSLPQITVSVISSPVLSFDSGKKGNCPGSPILEGPALIHPPQWGREYAGLSCVAWLELAPLFPLLDNILSTHSSWSNGPEPTSKAVQPVGTRLGLGRGPSSSCVWGMWLELGLMGSRVHMYVFESPHDAGHCCR